MLPTVCLGAALTIAAGWTMAGGDVAVTIPDRLYALASGGLLTAAGATRPEVVNERIESTFADRR